MVVLLYIHASSGRRVPVAPHSPTLGVVGLLTGTILRGVYGKGSSVVPAVVLEKERFLMACDGQGRTDLSTGRGGWTTGPSGRGADWFPQAPIFWLSGC